MKNQKNLTFLFLYSHFI